MRSENHRMPSSEERKPNYSRRFFWLAVFIAILFGGYSLAWYYVAGWLQDFATAGRYVSSTATAEAPTARTPMREWLSVPHRSLLRQCPFRGFHWQDVAASAAAFRSAAQVYDPFHIVAELDSPADDLGAGCGKIGFNWNNLRASVRLDDGFSGTACRSRRTSSRPSGAQAMLRQRACSASATAKAICAATATISTSR